MVITIFPMPTNKQRGIGVDRISFYPPHMKIVRPGCIDIRNIRRFPGFHGVHTPLHSNEPSLTFIHLPRQTQYTRSCLSLYIPKAWYEQPLAGNRTSELPLGS